MVPKETPSLLSYVRFTRRNLYELLQPVIEERGQL